MKTFYGFLLALFLAFPSFSAKTTNLLVFPQQGKTVSANTLIKAVGLAKKTICLASSRLTDPILVSALQDQAKKGVDVRILLSTNAANKSLYKLVGKNFKIQPSGGQASSFSTLKANYLIIDNRLLLFMGLPFTAPKLTPQKLKNYTMGCRAFGYIIHDTPIILEAQRIFNLDWLGTRIIPKGAPLLVGPDNLRTQLLSSLKRAQKTILIVTPTLEDEGIIRALSQAQKEGLKIKILTMAFDPKKKTDHKKNCILLRKIGADLHYMPLKEAARSKTKYLIEGTYILIDHKQLLLMSAPIVQNDIDYARQFGVITQNSTSIKEFTKIVLQDWANSKSSV